MPLELMDIKIIRKQLMITQAELAYRAKVSQSLIAKIESGLLDPTYNNARKIFAALQELQGKKDTTADQVMQTKIISVLPKTAIKDAIKKMKKFEISQMPVIDKNQCVGLVSEAILLDEIIEGRHENTVKGIMKDAPPTVPLKSSISIILNLLKFFPVVMVVDNAKIKGLITKADVIRNIYK